MAISIKQVEATKFLKEMTSGRTTPMLLECSETETRIKEEYVVKLRQRLDRRDRGLICETISSLVAQFLGLNTPSIAFVNLNAEMAALIEVDAGNVGLGFGSKLLPPNYFNLPNDYPLPKNLEQAAAEIVVFDALVQNFDRRPGKPNMFIKENKIYIFDHELAFSFLEDIIGQREPWMQAAFSGCVRGHFFYRQLKGKALLLDRILAAIKDIDDHFLLNIQGCIPEEWRDAKLTEIFNHIKAIVNNADLFIEGVRRELV